MLLVWLGWILLVDWVAGVVVSLVVFGVSVVAVVVVFLASSGLDVCCWVDGFIHMNDLKIFDLSPEGISFLLSVSG